MLKKFKCTTQIFKNLGGSESLPPSANDYTCIACVPVNNLYVRIRQRVPAN